MPHDVSRVRFLVPARPLSRMMLMDLSEDLIAGLLSGNIYVPPRRGTDVPWLFLLKLYDEGRNIFVMAVVEQTKSNQADYLALYRLGLASGAAFVLVNICCELSSMASAHHRDILCFPNIRPVTSGGPNDV